MQMICTVDRDNNQDSAVFAALNENQVFNVLRRGDKHLIMVRGPEMIVKASYLANPLTQKAAEFETKDEAIECICGLFDKAFVPQVDKLTAEKLTEDHGEIPTETEEILGSVDNPQTEPAPAVEKPAVEKPATTKPKPKGGKNANPRS